LKKKAYVACNFSCEVIHNVNNAVDHELLRNVINVNKMVLRKSQF